MRPYLSSDDRVMRDFPDEVIDGVRIVMHAIGARQALVGIGTTNRKPSPRCKKAAAPFAGVKVCPVPARYPMGSDKQLIRRSPAREVPADARASGRRAGA